MRINNTNSLKKLCPKIFTSFDIEEEEIIDEEKEGLKQEKIIQGFFPKYMHYFNGKLHDSYVLQIQEKKDSFVLSLNDIVFVDFSQALSNIKSVPFNSDLYKFELKFSFENVEVKAFYDVDDKGKLKEISLKEMLSICQEWLDEEIIFVSDEYIELAIHLWGKRQNNNESILLIKARKMKIEENQMKVWKLIFGNEYDLLVKEFIRLRKEGKYFDLNESEIFIRNFYKI